MIGMCVKGDISQAVHWAHMFLIKHWDCNYGQKGDTIIDVARNQIVDWFLETTNEYLLMLDSDVIPDRERSLVPRPYQVGKYPRDKCEF